ncbi:MAG: hypothetical protein ACYDDE_04005 [bacterium]
MKSVAKKIQKIDLKLCEKYPLYERIVNFWGLEQRFDMAVAKKFPTLVKTFTDEITIKRFSESQKAELEKIKAKLSL